MAASVKRISKYGLRAMEIYYLPIRNSNTGIIQSYISQLRINDPAMGVLKDEAFMPTAERTVVSEQITDWLIDNLFEDIVRLQNRDISTEWYSMYVPIRVLTKQGFLTQLQDSAEKAGVNLDNICLTFDNKILYEDHKRINSVLEQVKQLNMSSMIYDFGDEFSPINRLSSIRTDYVYLADSVTASLNSEKGMKADAALSLYDFLRVLKVKAVTPGIKNAQLEELLPEDFPLFTGSAAGNWRKARSIRQ